MSGRGRSRSRIAVVLGLSCVAAACGGSDDSDAAVPSSHEIVELAVTCGPFFTGLPFEYAMRNDIDNSHGLELTCVYSSSGPEVAASMISGETEIAQMVPANIFALLEQNEDVVAFLPVVDRAIVDLIVQADFPLPNADQGWEGVIRDLQGATIGVLARGGAAEDTARGLFVEAGLDPDEQTYVATGRPNTTLAALTNAEVDAAMTIEPGITFALAEGAAVQPFSIQELTGPPSMDWGSLVFTATRDYAEQNTEVLERFAMMWQEARDWVTDPANRPDVVELTTDHFGIEPELAEALLERDLPFLSTSLTLEPDRFDQVGDFFHEIGRFQQAYHVADYGFDVGG